MLVEGDVTNTKDCFFVSLDSDSIHVLFLIASRFIVEAKEHISTAFIFN